MKKKILAGLLAVSLVVVAAGCGNKVSSDNTAPKTQVKVVQGNGQKVVEAPKIVQNVDLTQMVKKEKHVIAGQIYAQGTTAVGAIIMDNKATKAYAKKIGDKYIKLMKTQFKGKVIDLQVVANGKNLYNKSVK